MTRDADVGGNRRSLQAVGLGQDGPGHGDGVAPRALGDGERDRGLLGAEVRAGRPRAEEDVLRGLLGPILHLGDVAEIDRAAGMDTHHGRGHVLDGGEERPGLDDDVAIAGGQSAGDLLAIGRPERPDRTDDPQSTGREGGGIEVDPDLAPVTPDQGGLGDLGNVLDLRIDLGRHPAQRQMVVVPGVEGEGQDRHVVDRPRLDHRR